MANWLRGVIHLRGSKQSLRKFFLNLIDPDDLEAANVNENSIYLKTTSHIGFHIKDTCGNYIDSYEMNINFLDAANITEDSVYLKTTCHVGFHIANTRGNYIDGYEVNINFSDVIPDENSYYMFRLDFSSCGTLDVEGMCNLSQLYAIDFAIDIYDAWTGINQDICIINGNIVRNILSAS